MKRQILACLLLIASQFVKGQDVGRVVTLHNEITDILDNAPKVYNESGSMYQKVTGHMFTSDCVLEIYTHSFPVRQGEDDYDLKRGYKKIIIDFSKVQIVLKNLKKTNYGYQGIFVSTVFGGEGGKYIRIQQTQPDQYGYHAANYEDVDMLGNVVIPIDTVELIPLLQELQEICSN